MSNIFFKPEHYKITVGEELLTHYRDHTTDSGKPKTMSFCSKCGTPMRITNDAKFVMIAPSGTFDDDIPWDPTQEVYIDGKRKWVHEITAREDGCIAKSA